MITRDDIIRMARETGCVEAAYPFIPWSVSQEALETLVRAAYAAGAAAEREAMIAIIDDNTDSDGLCCADDLLAAIRARSAK